MKDKRGDMISSLFPKAELFNQPEVLEFMNSLPQTFAEAENSLSLNQRYVDDNVLQNRIRLAPFIRKFHSEAHTLHDGIQDQWALLSDPATKLFVSTHQPNLFAYGGVFKKIVLLETLKTTIEKHKDRRIINLFVIVDHDFIEEVWVRRAQLPSFHHLSGLLQLRFSVNHSNKWQMVCNVPRPPERTLYNWKREIRSWIKKSSFSPSHQKKMADNFNQFWEEVEIAYSKARSYSDFNSFLMSRIINSIWGYNTLFVRLSEMSQVLINGFEFLISNLNIYGDVLRRTEQTLLSQGIRSGVSSTSYKTAPLWLHCKCGSKAPIFLSEERKLAKGLCMSCKKELILDLADPDNPDLSKFINYISPKAIAIPLLFSRDLEISCYCSGKAGVGYLIDANVICKHLGMKWWPLTILWTSKDIYYGMAQNQALNAIRMEVPEAERHLKELRSRNHEYGLKIHDIVVKRSELVKANRSLHSILEDLFQLKEEQRGIRREIETIEKAIRIWNLYPCIIDYAVNFGMVDTEKQWRTHLLRNGDLAAPVYFNQNNSSNNDE